MRNLWQLPAGNQPPSAGLIPDGVTPFHILEASPGGVSLRGVAWTGLPEGPSPAGTGWMARSGKASYQAGDHGTTPRSLPRAGRP